MQQHATGEGGGRNRLAQEPSPYLRQHADNPVDWYPWGPEALDRARREDKPILLSVGYSACHWCHVMAHESFEDPAVADRMNAYFVNVKVDREERPDLDQIYQGVVQLLGRGGGWPLTVFLMPDLRPFYGGTYFPKHERHGLPGFGSLLEGIHRAWTQARKDVEEQADQFQRGLTQLATFGLESPPAEVKPQDIVDAARRLERGIDRVNGGFGDAPKFPNPMNVALLLRGWRRTRDEQLHSAALLTLERMARGGIYDQLGGGFHRYSVDARWLVPHFEKMLYDNAQLLHLYAEAQQVAPRPLWRKVVEETIQYLAREMRSPEGAFYAAQDADSEGEEGKFFVWTPAQLAEVLTPEEVVLVREHFGVTDRGNFEHGTAVLEVVRTAEELAAARGQAPEALGAQLDQARRKLFERRRTRIAPGRDDKVLAAWNGLAIRGLAFAGRVFERQDWIALARGAADFVLSRLWRDGRLHRSYQEGQPRLDGVLEDYGDLAAGLVALYQATFEPRYLESARELADQAVTLFWDEARQAYLSAARGQKDLVVASYALHDNAYPSGASSLTEAQVGLAALTGHPRYLEQAAKYLKKLRDEAVRNPFGFGHLLLAGDAFVDGAAEVTLVGTPEEISPFRVALDARYLPTVAVAHVQPGAVPSVLAEGAAGRVKVNGHAAAYLCRSFACEPPLTSPADLITRVSEVAG